jgi:hypothetical protein
MMTFNSRGIMIRPFFKVRSWYGRLWRWIVHLFRRHTFLSVEQFFSSVHNSQREIEVVTERARGYELAMVKASRAGQQALFEQLTDGLHANRMEAQLVAIGMARYLSEEDLVRFYKKSDRGMRLDWIKNFTRQIPDEILVKKVRADGIGIFDNYAVLHYDPDVKSWAETQKEREEHMRDPILFGLMRGRRRLYVVGDWVDEYCNLTLDQVADALGKEVVREIE